MLTSAISQVPVEVQCAQFLLFAKLLQCDFRCQFTFGDLVFAMQLAAKVTVTAAEGEVERRLPRCEAHTLSVSKLPALSNRPPTPSLKDCVCLQLRLGGQQAPRP